MAMTYRPLAGFSTAAAITFLAMHGTALAAPDGATTSITRKDIDTAAAGVHEPSFATREERLKAKPLDWRTTIGKPKKPAAVSAAEALQARKAPASAEGGAPHPQADEEARKLYPEDWKK